MKIPLNNKTLKYFILRQRTKEMCPLLQLQLKTVLQFLIRVSNKTGKLNKRHYNQNCEANMLLQMI